MNYFKNDYGMKKIFFIILLSLFCQNVFAYDFSAVAPTGQTLYYDYVWSSGGSGEVVVVGGSGLTSFLNIPATVSHNTNSYFVVGVGNNAFYGCTALSSVRINGYVTSIGSSAFANCTGLTSVTIPSSVTSIGSSAFANCTGLTSVTIPSSVTSIASSTFANCTGLTSVTIPSSVTSIGSSAFSSCTGLTSVTIPSSVISIGMGAFWDCTGLTTLNFRADSCIYAGGNNYSAFRGCTNLSTINWGSNVRRIPSYLFAGLSGLTTVTIPYYISSIGDNAFKNCTGLTSVTIPNSIKNIGLSAFYGCTGLTSVNYNAVSCVSAGSSSFPVFGGCTNISTFNFGSSITRIPPYLCSGLSGLTSVSIPNLVDSIGNSAFQGCSGLTSLNFNAISCSYAGLSNSNRAFPGCSNITTVNFGNRVTTIPSYLCYGFSGLTSISIPNSVTSIGGSSFYGCTGLTSITIPPSVTSIGNAAFSGCTGLGLVEFNADSCLYMGGGTTSDRVFNNTYIHTINIGNNVKYIPGYAFSGCSHIMSITIPSLVSGIGVQAFSGCSSLDNVYLYPTVPPSVGSNSFSSSVDHFNVHCDAYSAYYNSTQWLTYRSRLLSYFYPTIEVTVSASNPIHGTAIKVMQNGSYISCDSTCIVCATGNYGYHFDHWSNGSMVNPDTLHLIGDSTIVAYFAPNHYSVVGLSGNPDQGYVLGSDTVNYLDTVVLTAMANHGYMFNHWSDGSYENPHPVVANGNRTITAYFVPAQFTLSVISSDVNMGTVSGGGNYNYQSNRTIHAFANTGYHFTQWNDGDINSSRTITLTQDTAFVAYFAPNQYAVCGVPNYPDRGYVLGNDTVDYLDTILLTAMANHGYMFDHWSDGAYENPHTVVANGNRTITAFFVPAQFSLSVISSDLNMGTVSGGGNYDYQSNRTIRAIANTGYHFTYWNDGDANHNRTITLTQDTTFTAYFAPNQYTLTLQSGDESLGIVTGGGEYVYHDTVTISATAIAPHYHFDRWSDNNTENPRQYVITGNTSLTAYFALDVHTVVVQVDNLAHGTVSGGGNYAYGSAATITAETPFSGWVFSHWSDGATYNPYTFAVLQDTVMTAYFVREGSQNDIDSIGSPNVNIYVEGQQIVAEGAEGNTVMVYDLYGRVLAIKRDEGTLLRFDAPATGTYLIRIGDSPARRVVVVR